MKTFRSILLLSFLFASTAYVNAAATITVFGPCVIFQPQYAPYTEIGYAASDSMWDVTPLVQVTGNLNVNVEGRYLLTYSLPDSFGAQPVSRIVIVGMGDSSNYLGDTLAVTIPLFSQANTFLQQLAATYNLQLQIVSGSINTSVPGTYPLTVQVQDSLNHTVCFRNIKIMAKVADINPPIITWLGDNPFYVCAGVHSVLLTFKVTDDYDADSQVTVTLEDSSGFSMDSNFMLWIPDTFDGAYTIVLRATDRAGNKSFRTVNLIIWICEGLGELYQNASVIYPMPVTDKLFLTHPPLAPTTYRILNMQGACIKEGTLDALSGIDVQALKQGVYQLLLESDGAVSSKRFVK